MSEPPERYRWGSLFPLLVDAAMMEDKRVARQEITHAIGVSEPIPSRYHYTCDGCADVWLSRSKSPRYRHQQNTVAFWSGEPGRAVSQLVRDRIGDFFDYVSLGPGDGRKDAELLFRWLDGGATVLYYPYDVSLQLTAAAVENVKKRVRQAKNGDSLRVKAVLADFRDLEHVRTILDHRAAPNVVALFGTIGNLANEIDFLQDLWDTMGEGDLLMLEVRLQTDADDLDDLTPEESRKHDFGPLDHYFGLTFARGQVKARWRDDASAIRGTKTIETFYEGSVPSLDGQQRVILQYIHLYEAAAFIARVEEVGFRLIYRDGGDGFLECVFERQTKDQ